MTVKHVSEMTPEEQAATLQELKRGPKPEPMPTDRLAKDMSPAERAAFIAEVQTRYP